jgi:hypothetical protein
MVATVRLLTGSNGTKSVCFTCAKSTRDPAAERTATSIASSLLFCVASAASRSTSSALNEPKGICFSTVSWFMVSVPVLSLHSTSTPASSSIAERRDTIALCSDSV